MDLNENDFKNFFCNKYNRKTNYEIDVAIINFID